MLPFALLVGGWLLWKLIYYGDILPNTFYVKVPSGLFKRGLLYVYVFHYSYLLVLFPPLLLIALPRLLRSAQATLLLPLVTLVALWTAYVALVGGDFMEFRFMVPALPPLMILIVWLACCHIRKPVFRLALVALVPLGSLHHVGTFDRVLDPPLVREIDSVTQLRAFLESPKHNWVVVGQTLGQLFGHDGRVTISVTAAGAIPFYSRLPSVDMHGLNDRWIAHHGERADSHPGHQILAPLDYLLARGVNLVIGHPILRPREELTEPSSLLHHVGIKPFKVPVQDISEFPAGAKVVAIPIDAQYSLIVLYLVPNNLVDRKIEERGWLTCPL